MQKLTYFSALAATFILLTITACGDVEKKPALSSKETPKIEQSKAPTKFEQPDDLGGPRQERKADEPLLPPRAPANPKPLAKTESQGDAKPSELEVAKQNGHKSEIEDETEAETNSDDEDLGPDPEFDVDEDVIKLLEPTHDDILRGKPQLDPNMTNTTPITPPWGHAPAAPKQEPKEDKKTAPKALPSGSSAPVASSAPAVNTPPVANPAPVAIPAAAVNTPPVANPAPSPEPASPAKGVEPFAIKDASGRFKMKDRTLGYAWIETQKDMLVAKDLHLEDEDYYVRCTARGYKYHMIATSAHLLGLQNHQNLTATQEGFTWTQIDEDGYIVRLNCEVHGE